MSLRMPLVVVIAAWKTGKEGAGSIAEMHEHKGGITGKKKPNKQTENMMQLAEASLIESRSNLHPPPSVVPQFDGGWVNMVR